MPQAHCHVWVVLLSRGSTPLHFAAAAKKDALAMCQLLITSGANPGQPDFHGYLPYEQAEQPEVRVLLGGPDQRLFDFAGEKQQGQHAAEAAEVAQGCADKENTSMQLLAQSQQHQHSHRTEAP